VPHPFTPKTSSTCYALVLILASTSMALVALYLLAKPKKLGDGFQIDLVRALPLYVRAPRKSSGALNFTAFYEALPGAQRPQALVMALAKARSWWAAVEGYTANPVQTEIAGARPTTALLDLKPGMNSKSSWVRSRFRLIPCLVGRRRRMSSVQLVYG